MAQYPSRISLFIIFLVADQLGSGKMMTILSDSLHLYPENAPLAVTIPNVKGKGPLGEYGLYNVL